MLLPSRFSDSGPQVSLFCILPPALKDGKSGWEEAKRSGREVRKAEVDRRRDEVGSRLLQMERGGAIKDGTFCVL